MALTFPYGKPNIYALPQKRRSNRKPRKTKGDNPSYQSGMGKTFYRTREWQKLRWQVLRDSDGRCGMCGRGRDTGTVLHVDHIKPRSRFPALELSAANLQVLCEDCNLGKGATTWKA